MEAIKNYPQKTFDHAVTAVDVVLFTLNNNKLKVLLLKLKEEPQKGKWALPGGLVAKGETLEQAAKRHLKTKVGIDVPGYIEQLYTFGDPNRDPLGWVVSVAYLATVENDKIKPSVSDRYEQVTWQEVNSLPELAYDHDKIIHMGIDRLKSKLEYTNIAYSLTPKEFTLTQLQKVYETILGKNLDKRNFRKKVLALGIIKSLNKKSQATTNRPAELFRFSTHSITETKVL